jgi:hypothetical protein
VWFVLLGGIATSAKAADFQFGGQTLTVPDGYVVEQVAAHPIVDRPINMAFDESGALYVTDSSGANEKPVQQLSNPTHRVLRLVDKDGDGCFESRTVFVDKLPFPEGAVEFGNLPHGLVRRGRRALVRKAWSV